MRRVVRFAWLAVVAAVALFVVGCGSSDSDDGGDETAAVGGKPAVNVGVVGLFSGAPGAPEATPEVLGAWARTVNARGGLNGHEVRLIVRDVGMRTGAGRAAVEELIEDDRVVAIVSQDPNDSTWVKYAESRSVPVMTATAAASAFASPNVFPITVSPITLGYAFADELKLLGDSSAIGYASETALNAQIVDLVRMFARPVGLSLPVMAKLSSSLPDYTALCEQIKGSGASSYFLSFGAPVVTKITEQCTAQGVELPQLLVGTFMDQSWRANAAFDGSVVVDGIAPFFDTAIPGVKDYRDAIEEHAADLSGSAQDNSFSLMAWAAAQMVAAGAERVRGELTGPALQDALFTIRDETLGGLIPPATYRAGETHPVRCWFTWSVADGDFVAGDDGAEPRCAPDGALAAAEAGLTRSLGG